MATTLKSTSNGAQRNIISKHGKRFIGLLTSFMGLVLLILKQSISGQAISLCAIVLLLVGILLFAGNLKLIFSSKSNKDVVLYFLIGLLCLCLGIVLVLYGNTLSQWIDLFIGAVIGLYGLILLIVYLTRKNRKQLTFDIILSLLLIACGVLICLLKVFSAALYILIVAIACTVIGITYIIKY